MSTLSDPTLPFLLIQFSLYSFHPSLHSSPPVRFAPTGRSGAARGCGLHLPRGSTLAIHSLSDGFRPINSTNTSFKRRPTRKNFAKDTQQRSVEQRDAALQRVALSLSPLPPPLSRLQTASRDEKCSQRGDCLACGVREFGSETMEPSLGHCSQTHLLMKYWNAICFFSQPHRRRK